MVGTTLGHYKLVETLGQGGMGVVYKARDLKLDRFVAIKVLPPDKTGDPSRKQRFAQEARAASALNHPNIVTIHDIAADGGVDFIVMEYVPGKTLDQLIPRKGMRSAEVLRYAAQMAAALSAAHEAGITHRDLKPGNIMVTDKGIVKILDFGLAKLTEPASPLGADEATATKRPETEEGAILGTVAYMSPEQAEGKPVDPRSDIFSFGSVLYEMCTGARAFAGETKLSTMSAILREDPKPARASNEDLPTELERIINRCLRKNPARRFQGTADLVVALEELREESDSGHSMGSARAASAKTSGRSWARWGGIAAAVAAVAAGGAWVASRRPAPPPAAPMQQGAVLTQLTFDTGLTTEPSYWPQGNLIAYASDRATAGKHLDIWIQQLNGGEARRLTTHESDDRTPDIAPDGSRIVFRSERDGGGLYVVPTIGGAERKIAPSGYDPKFSPDGQWIAYWTGDPGGSRLLSATQEDSQIFLVPAVGGSPQPMFNVRGVSRPAWSADGKHLLFFWLRTRDSDWYVAPVTGGEPKRTNFRAATVAAKLDVQTVPMNWTARGLYFSARIGDSTNTWTAKLNPATFEASGEISRVTTSAARESHMTAAGNSLVYASGLNNDDVYFLPINVNSAKAAGEPVRVTTNVAPEYAASISSDGTKIAYTALMSRRFVFFLRDLGTGAESRVAAMPELGPAPMWISPDGRRIAWSVQGEKASELHVGGPDGGSVKTNANGQVRSWGGKPPRILLSRLRDALLFDPDSNTETTVMRLEKTGSPGLQISMDGRYLSFYSAGEGKNRVYLAPIIEGKVATDPDLIAVTDGRHNDFLPTISPDSKTVYFYSGRDGFQCLWAQRMDLTAERPDGPPIIVKHFHSARVSPAHVGSGGRTMAAAANKIVFTMAERTGNIWRADLPQ